MYAPANASHTAAKPQLYSRLPVALRPKDAKCSSYSYSY